MGGASAHPQSDRVIDITTQPERIVTEGTFTMNVHADDEDNNENNDQNSTDATLDNLRRGTLTLTLTLTPIIYL